MSTVTHKEVVDLATPILVVARGGCVFIKQEGATIILTDSAVEELTVALMKAGAASIRAREGEPAARRRALDEPVESPFPLDPSYQHQPETIHP